MLTTRSRTPHLYTLYSHLLGPHIHTLDVAPLDSGDLYIFRCAHHHHRLHARTHIRRRQHNPSGRDKSYRPTGQQSANNQSGDDTYCPAPDETRSVDEQSGSDADAATATTAAQNPWRVRSSAALPCHSLPCLAISVLALPSPEHIHQPGARPAASGPPTQSVGTASACTQRATPPAAVLGRAKPAHLQPITSARRRGGSSGFGLALRVCVCLPLLELV